MVKKIFLDGGHGGSDSGATGNGLKEKDLTLYLTNKVHDILSNEYTGADLQRSRSTDKAVDLYQRSVLANNFGADVFISIHINAHGNTSADGFESFVWNGGVGESTKALQNVVHRKIMQTDIFKKDRGQKTANFSVLRNTRMSAVLLEFGFISNPADAKILKDKGQLDELARATAEGIAEFTGLTKTQKVQPPRVEGQEKSRFIDVPENRWSFNAIETLAELDVFNGYPDGSFRPTEPMTREQMAVVINKLYQLLK